MALSQQVLKLLLIIQVRRGFDCTLCKLAVHRACVAVQALPSCHVPTIEETARKRPLLHYTMISKQPTSSMLNGAMDSVTQIEAKQLLTARDRFQQTCLHIAAQLDKPEFLQVTKPQQVQGGEILLSLANSPFSRFCCSTFESRTLSSYWTPQIVKGRPP